MTTDRDRLRRLKALLDAAPEGEIAGDSAAASHDVGEEDRVVELGLAMVRAERSRLRAAAAPESAPRTLPRWMARPNALRVSLAANVLLVAGLIAGAAHWNPFAKFTPVANVVGREVIVYDARNMDEVWRHQFQGVVEIARIAPWEKGTSYILVAELGGPDAEGVLHCFDFRKGVGVWDNRVPRDEVEPFFGAERVDAGTFRCATLDFVDLEGDGEPEVMASFAHRVYLPCAVHTLARDGTLLGSYRNWGLLCTTAVSDLDQDGREELLLGGTNNAKEIQAATLVMLDRDHLSGASVDRFVEEPGFHDGSRERLLIPQFPADLMKALNWDRIHVFKINLEHDDARRPMVRVSIGTDQDHVMVLLDPELRPQGALPTDAFIRKMGGWREEGVITSDLAEPAVMDTWLNGYYLFAEGRQVHPPPAKGS